MRKGKKGSKENPITIEELEKINEDPFIIIEANIKDDFCNYFFEVTKGVGIGDKHKVDGRGIVEDDMRNAFAKFNVHLACIDDAFKYSQVEIDNIDQMHTHDLTGMFHVTGFKITGGKENECIILSGNKYVSAGGRIELKSPKIPLDNLSSYKWYNELLTVTNTARDEVAAYKNGKYTPVEVVDIEPAFKQSKLSFTITNPDDGVESVNDDLSDFEKAAV